MSEIKNLAVIRLENCFINTSIGEVKTNIRILEEAMNNGLFVLLRTNKYFEKYGNISIDGYNIPHDYLSIFNGNVMTLYDKQGLRVENLHVGRNSDIREVQDIFKIEQSNTHIITTTREDILGIEPENKIWTIEKAEEYVKRLAMNKPRHYNDVGSIITNLNNK